MIVTSFSHQSRVALSFSLSPLDDDGDEHNGDGDDDDDGDDDVFIDGLRAYLRIFITTITTADYVKNLAKCKNFQLEIAVVLKKKTNIREAFIYVLADFVR